jgi:hypothetical protein
MQGGRSLLSQSHLGRRFCTCSRPIVLTHLIRPMAPPPYARRLRVQSPLASSSGATTAESAAASFAGSTRPSRSVSMSLHASIPRANCIARAIVATDLSASGSIFVRAAPTARALAAAQRPFRWRLQHQPSARKIHALAASRRACKARGTGAPSEPATFVS